LTEISNFDEAAENFLKAEGIYEEIDHVGGMNDANNRMGIIYSALQDYERASEYYLKVVQRCEERNSKSLLRAATHNLAETYTLLGDTINARKWSLKIIDIRKITEDNLNRSYLYKNLSDYALLNNDENAAIRYLDSSLYFAELVNVPAQVIERKLLLSRQYRESGAFKKQRALLLSATEDIERYKFSVYDVDIYEELAQSYQKSGNFKDAAQFYGKSITARDSLDELSGERELKKKEEAAKILKYNQRIADIESDRALKDLELKKQRQRNNFLWLFSVIALLGLLYLWKNVSDRKRSQEQLSSQNKEIEQNLNDKEVLLREIHHRVKNNLQVVSSMLNLNLRYVKDHSAKSILLESRNRVKSMALIHQKLYQEEHLKGVKLKSYLESLVNNLLHSYKKKNGKLKVHYDVDEMILDVDTLIPFGLIVNEVFTNSLKHAFVDKDSGNVWFYVKVVDDVLVLQIKDDGVGMLANKELNSDSSFGMTLIDSLAEKLKADVSITNGQGTTVELKIKKYSMYS